MQVFKFNPVNGVRGEQIGNVDVRGCSNMEMVSCSLPAARSDASWRIATKLEGRDGQSINFDEPVCFCLGQFTCGQDAPEWHWVVYLPTVVMQ